MFNYLTLSFQIKKYLQWASLLMSTFADSVGPEGFPCLPDSISAHAGSTQDPWLCKKQIPLL